MRYLIFIFILSLTLACGPKTPKFINKNAKFGLASNAGSGIISAAEINDNDNYFAWQSLHSNNGPFTSKNNIWQIQTLGRIQAICYSNWNSPIKGAQVKLFKKDTFLNVCYSNRFGQANAFDPRVKVANSGNTDTLKFELNNGEQFQTIFPFGGFQGGNFNFSNTNAIQTFTDDVDIAFLVDATATMQPELDFLKSKFSTIINEVKTNKPQYSLRTACIFYKDEIDDFVTKISNLDKVTTETNSFINSQSVGGGGDLPEALDVALKHAIDSLYWVQSARAKIIFLICDAPAHKSINVINNLKYVINACAQNNICIIPIASKRADLETEYLLRSLALVTDGSYVFLTEDKNATLPEAQNTVGSYNVEFLQDIIRRIIIQRM